MEEAVQKAGVYAGGVIIEQYIPGYELTVGILGPEALPVIEIVTGSGIYDFNAKYKDEETQYVVPARIDKGIYAEAQKLGLEAHNSLGCRSFSRVDMRLTPSGVLFVLEINTGPGFTERSLLPLAARTAGIDFGELCLRILSMAIKDNIFTKKEVS